jgi:chromosome partitioning protein
MRVIALINQKGGVGKTTSAVNLGSGLVRLGKKVLLLDIDPQANLSLHLDIDVSKITLSVYDLLLGRAEIEQMITTTSEPGLHIIPSHIDLCSAELELVNTVGREVILRDAIKRYAEQAAELPDYILIDCPPSLSLLSLNALAAAEEVIVPIQAEFFALQGMGKLVEVVNVVKSRINSALRISGILICMYRSQTTLAREVLQEVESFFGEIVFQTKIRQNIKLAEAPGHGKTIFDYDPSSNGAADYEKLAREVTGEYVQIDQESCTDSIVLDEKQIEASSPAVADMDISTFSDIIAAENSTAPCPEGSDSSEEETSSPSIPPEEERHTYEG